MGLFDTFKKNNAGASNSKMYTGSSIERDVSQEVILTMNSIGITKMPILKFFHNDGGIFLGTYMSHMLDPRYAMIRKQYGDDMYLRLLGAHAMGTGMYVTICQAKFHKPVDQFTSAEAISIKNDFRETDPYELALKEMGFPIDGSNKKYLDKVITVAIEAYKASAGKDLLNEEYLKSYMQVMYNAGITVVIPDT